MGVDLAATAMAEVSSAAAGLVLYADDLGIYGSTVLIDHGFGLSSLYGHLSAIGVKAGDSVTAGQVIGRTGATGLAGGDHLHFEVRVHGVPVNPIEWWDGTWLKDHIEEKIASVKRVLVGGSAE
jgi:murein DD-endopeptidase MepM/ murein hydrolase activator NlpD